MQRDEKEAEMANALQVIERHIAAFRAKDQDAEPWAADAELVSPGGRFEGREQVLGFLKVFWAAFPDARLEISRSIEDGELAAAEGMLIGTQTGALQTPDGEIPPTGRGVQVRWMSMYEVRGDEIASEHLYFDQVELMTQLGVMPAAPAEQAS
jgi:predicted ester cyclase